MPQQQFSRRKSVSHPDEPRRESKEIVRDVGQQGTELESNDYEQQENPAEKPCKNPWNDYNRNQSSGNHELICNKDATTGLGNDPFLLFLPFSNQRKINY